MGNILLTGANGLLGSYLVPLLSDANHVWAISRQNQSSGNSNVTWIACDLSESLECINDLLPEKIDAVIHLAQSSFFRDFPQRAQHIFDVNVSSTMFLLEQARLRNCKSFINASSGSVYANSTNVLKESNLFISDNNYDLYPASKLCSELLVNSYRSLFNIVNLRFFFIYGRGQDESMLIPRLINSVKRGNQITLQGNDGLLLNPVHASDAAMAVKRALDLNGAHTFNIAGNEIFSLRKVGDIIGDILGIEPVFLVNEAQQPQSYEADISAMKELLHVPAMSFHDGIADYCETIK